MRNHSYENEFHLHVHFRANQTHFHLNGFAGRLVLKQRHRVTRKWPIHRTRKFFKGQPFFNAYSTVVLNSQVKVFVMMISFTFPSYLHFYYRVIWNDCGTNAHVIRFSGNPRWRILCSYMTS